MDSKDLNIEELKWDDVQHDIRHANPSLAEILEQFEPKPTFIKARYQFGNNILNQGEIHLPTANGDTVPLNSNDVPASIRKKLGYSYVPMALIMSKAVEVFFETEERVMPSKLFGTGTTFGLWEAFDPPPSDFVRKVWNLSAGARTLFMLPKIADGIAHARLKRDYGITSYPPKKLLFQHRVFADLAKHAPEKDKWYCDLLFFCNKWLEENENNITCLKLHKYWLHEAWRQSFNCRNQMSYDVAWEAFTKEVTRRNWKPRPYIINTIKHLMSIAEGVFPGFTPACGSEIAAPIKFIQEAYVNSYSLKRYAPVLMHPHHLKTSDRPVYYSMSLPTLLEYAPQADNPRSIMADMRELKMLMEVLAKSMEIKDTQYDFFHSDADQFGDIRLSSEMLAEDVHLGHYPEKYKKLGFADCGPFFRGCICIKHIDT